MQILHSDEVGNRFVRRPKFDPTIAAWEAFVVVVCENHFANLLEHRGARRGISLKALAKAALYWLPLVLAIVAACIAGVAILMGVTFATAKSIE